MQYEKKADAKSSLDRTEQIFADKGKEIVRNGMHLILDRLKFAKRYDESIRNAICAVEYESDEKAAQVKSLVEALRCVTLVDTSEVLSLVMGVLERQQKVYGAPKNETASEVVVTLDKGVEKWAQ